MLGLSCLTANAQILVNTDPVEEAVKTNSQKTTAKKQLEKKQTTKKESARLNNDTDPDEDKKKSKKSKTEEVYGKLGYSAYVENVSDEAAKIK